MANPNLLTASSVVGESVTSNFIGTGSTSILSAPGSGHVFRVVGLRILNLKNGTASTVTITVEGAEILHQVNVPANGTLDVITKDFPLYIKESINLNASASVASNTLRALIVYEDVS